MPQLLTGLSAIADDYDAVLCDVWGVLHNGLAAHTGAPDALRRFQARGPVVLMTNAPRPSTPVIAHLASLGITDGWDAIVSSGDVVRRLLIEDGVRSVYHIGHARDLPLYEGTGITVVETGERADMIVLAGLRDDDTETPEDYRDEMAALAASGMPALCANPDVVVERGEQLLYCAGALAKMLEDLGRPVVQVGKPHAPIYRVAMAEVHARAPDARRVLVIGDGLPTDIRGAVNEGIDALFITDGIHQAEVGTPGSPDPGKVTARLMADGLDVPYYAPRLVW